MNFWFTLEKPFFALAPMEGITDDLFRSWIQNIAPPQVFFTEFIRADNFEMTLPELQRNLPAKKKNIPLVLQLWGRTPESFYQAARLGASLGFSGIDINLGCSVKKILKSKTCGALIGQNDLVKEIIKMTELGIKESGQDIPLSIKTRIGLNCPDLNWIDFLLNMNIQALSVHARTVEQGLSGQADWKWIQQAVNLKNDKKANTLLIGNGDITRSNYLQLFQQTQADGLMIGREILHDPFIFQAQQDHNVSIIEKINSINSLVSLYEKAQRPFYQLRKFFKPALKELSENLTLSLMKCSDYTESHRLLEAYLSTDFPAGNID